MADKVNIKEKGTPYQFLEFQSKWHSLMVDYEVNGEVEITMVSKDSIDTVSLNQDQIKILIEHLQKQLK